MRALLALALISGCLSPSQRTTALALAAVGTTTVDWVQSRGYVRGCTEQNPILGPCGERVNVDVYFATVIIGTLALGAALGDDWADVLFAGVAGVEGATVWRNATTP